VWLGSSLSWAQWTLAKPCRAVDPVPVKPISIFTSPLVLQCLSTFPVSNLQLTEFVKRPGVGTASLATRVRASFFQVQSFPQQNIHHYDVTITPDFLQSSIKKVLEGFWRPRWTRLSKVNQASLWGRKNIFSSKTLPFEGDAGTFELCDCIILICFKLPFWFNPPLIHLDPSQYPRVDLWYVNISI
jgi:hypothetical protein